MKTRLISGAASILGIIIIYGVINLIAVGGQSLWHSSDKSKLKEMKVELASELQVINDMESTITSKGQELDTLKSRIDNTTDNELYNTLADQYNNMLPDYNTLYDSYSSKIESYNLKVEEANALAKKVGTTWYIVPLPGRGHE